MATSVRCLWDDILSVEPRARKIFDDQGWTDPRAPENPYQPKWVRHQWYVGVGSPLMADEKFFAILNWFGGPEYLYFDRARSAYERIGKPLREYRPRDVDVFLENWKPRYRWPKDYFKRLIRYLDGESSCAKILERLSRMTDPEEGLRTMQRIYGSRSTKIPSCFLRGYAFVDAFPIDTNLKKVLKRYELPEDALALVRKCVQEDLPTRAVARAAYDLSYLKLLPLYERRMRNDGAIRQMGNL